MQRLNNDKVSSLFSILYLVLLNGCQTNYNILEISNIIIIIKIGKCYFLFLILSANKTTFNNIKNFLKRIKTS